MTNNPRAPGALQVVSRLAAALFAGYGFTWGCTALVAVLLYAAGMDLTEATALATMLGFLLYLAMFCWAFAARRLALVWAVLAGGGATAGGLALLLSRQLT